MDLSDAKRTLMEKLDKMAERINAKDANDANAPSLSGDVKVH